MKINISVPFQYLYAYLDGPHTLIFCQNKPEFDASTNRPIMGIPRKRVACISVELLVNSNPDSKFIEGVVYHKVYDNALCGYFWRPIATYTCMICGEYCSRTFTLAKGTPAAIAGVCKTCANTLLQSDMEPER